ncbi:MULTISPECIES: hypothetical protein [unclassified Thiocapsa]|uniref:hypothetical protein n=1 Tax=unclassified Thiocapsa TaxID=2641286 RepID=UPI0035B3CFD5
MPAWRRRSWASATAPWPTKVGSRTENNLQREQETAKQAKAAIAAGAGKTRNLEEALEDGRTAHADALRTLLDELRHDHGNARS